MNFRFSRQDFITVETSTNKPKCLGSVEPPGPSGSADASEAAGEPRALLGWSLHYCALVRSRQRTLIVSELEQLLQNHSVCVCA